MTAPSKSEIALLSALSRGQDFTSACRAIGDRGVQVAFECLSKRWIAGGSITREGRDALSRALKPTPWEITVMPSEKKTSPQPEPKGEGEDE